MPLSLEPRPLPDPQIQALKAMFVTAQMGTLRQVLDAKATKLEVDAQLKLAESDQYDGYQKASIGDLQKAREYRTALRILKEIEMEKGIFELYSVKSQPN